MFHVHASGAVYRDWGAKVVPNRYGLRHAA
jgi:hypothetical protein